MKTFLITLWATRTETCEKYESKDVLVAVPDDCDGDDIQHLTAEFLNQVVSDDRCEWHEDDCDCWEEEWVMDENVDVEDAKEADTAQPPDLVLAWSKEGLVVVEAPPLPPQQRATLSADEIVQAVAKEAWAQWGTTCHQLWQEELAEFRTWLQAGVVYEITGDKHDPTQNRVMRDMTSDDMTWERFMSDPTEDKTPTFISGAGWYWTDHAQELHDALKEQAEEAFADQCEAYCEQHGSEYDAAAFSDAICGQVLGNVSSDCPFPEEIEKAIAEARAA